MAQPYIYRPELRSWRRVFQGQSLIDLNANGALVCDTNDESRQIPVFLTGGFFVSSGIVISEGKFFYGPNSGGAASQFLALDGFKGIFIDNIYLDNPSLQIKPDQPGSWCLIFQKANRDSHQPYEY